MIKTSEIQETSALLEELVARQVDEMRQKGDIDQRMVSIAATHFLEGFMALNRAVTQPKRSEEPIDISKLAHLFGAKETKIRIDGASMIHISADRIKIGNGSISAIAGTSAGMSAGVSGAGEASVARTLDLRP